MTSNRFHSKIMQSGWVLAGFLAVSAGTAAPPDEGVTEVRDCMADNLVERGALRELEIRSYDGPGEARTLNANMYWRTDPNGQVRVTLHVNQPDSLEGAAYLLRETAQEDEIYVYLPSTKTVKRVTGQGASQSLWGTDFSYGDIRYIQGLLLGDATTRKADASVSGRSVYVLETKAEIPSTGFRKVISYVDKESCTLLKAEFFDSGKTSGETPQKVLQGDPSDLFKTDVYSKEVWLLLGYTMQDLPDGTRSEVRLSEVFLLEDIASAAFDPETFFEPIEGGP